MAQTNFTPIQLYNSATAAAVPLAANLAAGELALNTLDGKLYYKNSAGAVTLLASTAGSSGDVVGPASSTDNAVVRFDGTTGKLVKNSVVTVADTTGNIAGVGTLGVGAITTSGVLTYGGVTLNNAVTGTGNMVLSTSPTLTTPALGTPSALVGTNITGTASGLTAGNVTTNANLTGAITSTGNATLLGSFSSANLAGALTDETGSGSAVFATSPTFVTPALGTPTSGVVTNLTGTASININGTVGATTPSTIAATTISAAGTSSEKAFKTPNIAEVATVSATAATGTINYDVTTQSVLYFTTNASGNFTVNFRGSSGTSLNTIMATGESISATFLVTNGATAYYNSVVQVDGSTVTPKWQGGTAPTSGNASSIDSYTYAIIKTGNAAFTVLAAQTKFA